MMAECSFSPLHSMCQNARSSITMGPQCTLLASPLRVHLWFDSYDSDPEMHDKSSSSQPHSQRFSALELSGPLTFITAGNPPCNHALPLALYALCAHPRAPCWPHNASSTTLG